MRDNQESRDRYSDDSLKIYLRDIGRYPLLTAEDERELWEQMQPGKEAIQILASGSELSMDERLRLLAAIGEYDSAKTRFIQSNLRLVVSVAKKYADPTNMLDLIQEGNLGLEHAVDKFDAKKGFKFSTYATWWIRQAVTRSLPDVSLRRPVRLPSYINEDILRLRKLKEKAAQSPDPGEFERIAIDAMGVDKLENTLAIMRAFGGLSLNATLDEDSSTELIDVVADKSADSTDVASVESVFSEELYNVLESGILEEREIDILKLRFGFGGNERMTLEEVGKMFSLTRERIRQIEARALSKLRSVMSSRREDWL